MALASKKEAKATSKLQATEKAAAKAVALLDKKEEEVQQLQQVITDSETSFFAVWLRRDGTSEFFVSHAVRCCFPLLKFQCASR